MSKPSPRRGPGRPKDDGELRERIVDQAELAFAERGFAGTSLRDVAAQAGVNQALIRYYFGSKQDLFDEVFRRKGSSISGRRHVLLDQLLARPETPGVAQIIRAYLQPQWDMKNSGPAGAAFVRLQARLHAEPEEHALRLRREVYDASVLRYIQALSAILPAIPRATISMRMAFLVGTYLFMLNDLGRLNDLTEGQIGELDSETILEDMVRFLSAGISAAV
ncbi:MAG: TetR/AcrR family transcriptional regulator [Devosia sp.]|jgi:AcrR family transcriptional regulator|nr:TetR/AcrR family transcriptional regulator [Devosia sp.]